MNPNNAVFVLAKLAATVISSAFACTVVLAQQDPGVRGGAAGAGGPIGGLTGQQQDFFKEALRRFNKVSPVSDGLGPRFNLDSCAGCHSQPAIGGSSPSVNPQIAAAKANGANNTIPSFITPNGPVREARFPSDGGVHDLFVITGRADAPGCTITQPDFAEELERGNVIFRIPTPTFGLGLVELTPDQNLIADVDKVSGLRESLNIDGHFNHTGNDGTITRFGWKAQNKSMMVFAGEAYNVELGVTNELFPNKRETDPSCQFNNLPEDFPNVSNPGGTLLDTMSDTTGFANFMAALAAPTPAPATPSTTRGQAAFMNAGCGACHIPQHTTGPAILAGLSKKTYAPYSDFQIHDMGKGLEDRIAQGEAGGREFRTAPLWGIGQRIFFLHDGRTSDLLQAILAHKSDDSEASKVIDNFNALSDAQQQDLLNFLRGL